MSVIGVYIYTYEIFSLVNIKIFNILRPKNTRKIIFKGEVFEL